MFWNRRLYPGTMRQMLGNRLFRWKQLSVHVWKKGAGRFMMRSSLARQMFSTYWHYLVTDGGDELEEEHGRTKGCTQFEAGAVWSCWSSWGLYRKFGRCKKLFNCFLVQINENNMVLSNKSFTIFSNLHQPRWPIRRRLSSLRPD